MRSLVLDAEALSLLARDGRRESVVRAAMQAAFERDEDVGVPAAVLAELYRGKSHDQQVDACLAREGGIAIVDTDRALARRIGHLLAAADLGSAHHVDAAVVASSAAAGGGVVLTGDPDDVGRLASSIPGIAVEAL